VKNFTKSCQETFRRSKLANEAANSSGWPWVYPWRDETLVPTRRPASRTVGCSKYTVSTGNETGSILAVSLDQTPKDPFDDTVEPGHTFGHWLAKVRMLLSFQRPSPPSEGVSLFGCAKCR
jgi:hypothetical protein